MLVSEHLKFPCAVRCGLLVVSFVAAWVCLGAEPYDRVVEGLLIPTTAWFDTGYVTKDSPRVTTSVLFPDSTSSSVDLFGTKDRVAGCFILNADSGTFYLRYGTAGSTSKGSYAANTVYDIVCGQSLVVNGKELLKATAGSMASNELNLCFPRKRLRRSLGRHRSVQARRRRPGRAGHGAVRERRRIRLL